MDCKFIFSIFSKEFLKKKPGHPSGINEVLEPHDNTCDIKETTNKLQVPAVLQAHNGSALVRRDL